MTGDGDGDGDAVVGNAVSKSFVRKPPQVDHVDLDRLFSLSQINIVEPKVAMNLVIDVTRKLIAIGSNKDH